MTFQGIHFDKAQERESEAEVKEENRCETKERKTKASVKRETESKNLPRRKLWEGSQNEEISKDDVLRVYWLGVMLDKNFSYI